MVKLQTPSLQLCQKNEPHYWYFSSNLSSSKSPCFKVVLKGKSHNFEIEWILCYSMYLVLYIQPLQFVRWSDGWSIFYETKKSRLIKTVCFRVQIIKGYMEITEWNHTVESAVHGILNKMRIAALVCWCLNKLAIAQTICIYTLLYVWHFI